MKKTWNAIIIAAALFGAALPYPAEAQEPSCEWTVLDEAGAIINTGTIGEDGNLALTAGVELSDDVPTVNTGGQALRFTGENPEAAAESSPSFDPLAGQERFTIMAWVRRESESDEENRMGRIFSDIEKISGWSHGVDFHFSGATGYPVLQVNSNTVGGGSSTPSDNWSWHHFAVVYDGTRPATNYATYNVHFYVDGVQRGVGHKANGAVHTNSARVAIGNSSTSRSSTNQLVGSIDDVFVFPGWAPEPSGDGNLNLAIRNWMLVDDIDFVPDEEEEPEPEGDHLVPPVIVDDVVAQTIGSERQYEELQPGLIFVDASTGELCYVNEENPKGRAVCVCKDFPDWHSFTKTVRLNGNKLELNPYYSLMAESHALSARYGTNTIWTVVGETDGDLAGMTVSLADASTLMISCNAIEGVLQVCTNLMEADRWKPATNAVVVAETDVGITWRVTLMMDQPGTEIYRILNNGPSVTKGFHVYPELHPHGGIEMGGETWTNWPDLDGYATDGDVSAVSNDLAAHKSASNPHGITAAGIGALTAETDATALAALNTASNALANRIGAAETNALDFATRDWAVGYVATNHQSLVGYATETWVGQQGFLTEHQSLEDYATTASVSAVSSRVSTIESDYVTSADISDFATNGAVASLERRLEETIASNAAALTTLTNALGQRVSEFETVHLGWYFTNAATATTNAHYLDPTTIPTRTLELWVNVSGYTNAADLCKLYVGNPSTGHPYPTKPTTITIYCYSSNTNSTVDIGVGTGMGVQFKPRSTFRRTEFSYWPEIGLWLFASYSANFNLVFRTSRANSTVPTNCFQTIEEWVAWRKQQSW